MSASLRRPLRMAGRVAAAGVVASPLVLALAAGTATPAFAGPGGLKVNLQCVWHNSDGSTTTVWDYTNTNGPQDVPVGDDNTVVPNPADRGQPTHFESGSHYNAWVYTSRDQQLSWQVLRHGDTASWASPVCQTNPVPMIGNWWVAGIGGAAGVAVLVFAFRRNRSLRALVGVPRLPRLGRT